MKQSQPASPDEPITETIEPSTLLELCRKEPEWAASIIAGAHAYQEQLMRRIERGNILRHKLENRIDAFRLAIADAELGEGPAFNMREALAADDRAIESEREYLKESDRAP